MSSKSREIWVDNIKVFACILVVLGHFFQSMVKSNILPENMLYLWFNQTVYLFHVPLFFICSGYIYQKYSKVDSLAAWKSNVIKKLTALGIPYLTFSTATWILKTAFSGSVNDQMATGLFETLFLQPTAPYWYLYSLFFIFSITPTFQNETYAYIGLFAACVLKAASVMGGTVYAVRVTLTNEIWFVLGMFLSEIDLHSILMQRTSTVIGALLGGAFLMASVLLQDMIANNSLLSFALGLLACIAVILVIGSIYIEKQHNKIGGYLSRYTMPIFLMHTIFAAPLRTVLLKLGIMSPFIHVLLGLAISFAGPVVSANVMGRFPWMDFFLYPTKYIRLRQKNSNRRW